MPTEICVFCDKIQGLVTTISELLFTFLHFSLLKNTFYFIMHFHFSKIHISVSNLNTFTAVFLEHYYLAVLACFGGKIGNCLLLGINVYKDTDGILPFWVQLDTLQCRLN